MTTPRDGLGGSVSRLLAPLRAGNETAFGAIVERFLPQFTRLAKKRINADHAKAADPEELALSAMHSLWNCVERQSDFVAQLTNRDDLLKLLVTLTNQKVKRSYRFHTQDCRDVRRTLRESDAPDSAGDNPQAETVLARELPPGWEMVFNETLADWLSSLRPVTHQIVQLLLQNYKQGEIAKKLVLSLRTVERELSEIRSVLKPRIDALREENQ